MLIKINGEAEFQQEIDKGGVKIVKFGASWCGPCAVIDKTLEELEDNISEDIIKIDVDLDAEIAGEFGVMSIPTLLFIKDKAVVDTLVGAQKKDKILEILELVKGE